MTHRLRDLYAQLNEDMWRRAHPFSEDVDLVNRVVHFPYARDPERAEALGSWLQRFQPCLFGRLAAKRDAIHYCFVTESEILDSDESVQQKIGESRRLWKQRALRGVPKHGFLLAVCAPRLAFASSDAQLRQFSLRIQELAQWQLRSDIKGAVMSDNYNARPTTTRIPDLI